MQGKHGHLSREQKQLALRLHAKGWRLVDIARESGCSAPMVGIMARTGRHVDAKPFGWIPRAGSLRSPVMTDAQMGLAVATPAIIVMALLLYRMGVLQKGGVTAAVLMSLAIATMLFLEQ